jgi:hypothetical protein
MKSFIKILLRKDGRDSLSLCGGVLFYGIIDHNLIFGSLKQRQRNEQRRQILRHEIRLESRSMR